MEKQEIRKEIRSRKRQYSSIQLEELSLSVLTQLSENEHLQDAHTILMYYSLPDEVYTHAYIDLLVKRGKKVLLPVVVDDKHMILREYTGPQDLKEGAFHIMEPIGKLYPENQYPDIELGIIPGMSFDYRGNRLGRGKGFYDRFLQQAKGMYKIGICFDFQLWEGNHSQPFIPTEETDIQMDEVISGTHTYSNDKI